MRAARGLVVVMFLISLVAAGGCSSRLSGAWGDASMKARGSMIMNGPQRVDRHWGDSQLENRSRMIVDREPPKRLGEGVADVDGVTSEQISNRYRKDQAARTGDTGPQITR